MRSVRNYRTRSDAWTAEIDARLAEVVLNHIRSGSTQLRAFEEAADILGRTVSACGFRWNGVVRKNCQEQIEQAKQTRKNHPHTSVGHTSRSGAFTPVSMTPSKAMGEVIVFLQTLETEYSQMLRKVKSLEAERDRLRDRLAALENGSEPRKDISPSASFQMGDDAKTILAIMERARKFIGDR